MCKKAFTLGRKAFAAGLGCMLMLSGGNISYAVPITESVVSVGQDEERETIALNDYYGYPEYTSVNIGAGGKWRPVQGGYTYLNGNLTINNGGMLDIGWATGGYGGATPTLLYISDGVVTLYDGGIIRMNYQGLTTLTDQIIFINTDFGMNTNTTFAFPDGQANLYFQLGHVSKYKDGVTSIDWSTNPTYISVDLKDDGLTGDFRIPVISFSDGMGFYKPLDVPTELTVTAQGSFMDTPLTKYWIEPELEFRNETYLSYKGWWLTGFTVTNSGLASEAVMSAADNQRAMLNMWRLDDSFVFNRTNDLRMLHRTKGDISVKKLAGLVEQQVAEGVWATMYKGKYKYDSSYGRGISQNYQGIQFGFDKSHEGDFYNGKLYRGIFISLSDADTGFSTGKGALKSRSIGLYNTWLGNKGHFLDTALRFSRLENEYTYTDSSGTSGVNDYKTWAWALSTQYGYRKTSDSGFYYEPQIGLSYGRMNATDYTLANGLEFRQDSHDFLTGRIGVLVGKTFGENNNAGNIYVKAILNHDFIGASDAFTTFGNAQLKVDPLGDKDTWVDMTIGANKKISSNGAAHIELTKTIGGDVRSDWQVSGGFTWSWGAAPRAKESGNQSRENGKDAVMQELTKKYITENVSNLTNQSGNQDNLQQNERLDSNTVEGSVYNTQNDFDTPYYALEPITVEASRPDWEKNLSPGTVSVVYPEEYKGEMKKLPEMLQTVAGVFVQQVQGTGHYSVARVRGSTGAQVNIFVDGVLMNSAGQAGVDLSTIPIENVARIEVYKGYIPARFSGASIGGVINIVTKRPGKASGAIGYGMSSFDGFTGNIEVTAPLGSGSLMVAANRDQARGEFGYDRIDYNGGNKEITKVWRQNNQYNHTDAMVKWQDDNWLFKVSYVRKHDGAPAGANSAGGGDKWINNNGWFRGSAVTVKDENTDIIIGRRQQTGNLEWGVQLNYGHHEKTSRFHRDVSQWTPTGVNSYYKHDIYGAKLDGSWKMGESHLVEFLFSTTKETMKTDGNYFGRPEYSSIIGDARAFINKYDIKNHYFQIQDSIMLDRKKSLIFTPIWRAQKMEMTSFDQPGEADWKYSYGLGLKKHLNDATTLRASYGTYWRAPNFYELFGDGGVYVRPRPSTLGGADITWESGKQYDIGIDWNGKALGAKTDVSLTYFNRQVKDLANHVITADGSMYYLNAGEGKIDGLELETNWHWKRWEFNQSVTWNNSKITKTLDQWGGEYDPNQRFTGIPEWETNSRLTYYFGDNKTSIFVEYHYTSDIDYNISATHASYYGSIGITNIGVKYNPGKSWKFTAGINDMFDKGPKQKTYNWNTNQYQDYGIGFPQQGRTFYMTMQYLF